MSPTLIVILLKDAQKGWGQGRMGGHSMSLCTSMPIANNAEVFFAAWNGALSCMKIILLQIVQFFFQYHGRKWSVRNSVIFTTLVNLKLPTSSLATAVLISQPCWDMVAIHQSSTTPSIWNIQGCIAFISEWLRISLHVFQPYLLVSIVWGWPNRRLMHNFKPLEHPQPKYLRGYSDSLQRNSNRNSPKTHGCKNREAAIK